MRDFIREEDISRLLALENVTGVGFGLKQVKGRITGERCALVFVREKRPKEALAAAQIVPPRLEGLATDVMETGEFRVNRICIGLNEEDGHLVSRRSRWRPAPAGVSIGHPAVTAGTLGAVVYDRHNGRELILSNNHILANTSDGEDGRACLGDPILQPGTMDGGLVAEDVIARLYRYIPLLDREANLVDAAVAIPLRPGLLAADILALGRPHGIVQPLLGMEVRKSGRTTGRTAGCILAVGSTVYVHYRERRLLFRHQIVTSKFSRGGDSGALVVNGFNWAVGLLFCDSPLATILNPIGPVLDRLDVALSPRPKPYAFKEASL